MKRIKLSKDEKRAMRWLAQDVTSLHEDVPDELQWAMTTLDEKGLVTNAFDVERDVVGACLSVRGIMYWMENPRLRNPIDWPFLIAVVSFAITIIGWSYILFFKW